ncbi:hypothetical protein CEK25_003252 [Fusarium fujikuroi]|nr:hypothetical protein CEK25_003252 [Fusarium fujikuroi]
MKPLKVLSCASALNGNFTAATPTLAPTRSTRGSQLRDKGNTTSKQALAQMSQWTGTEALDHTSSIKRRAAHVVSQFSRGQVLGKLEDEGNYAKLAIEKMLRWTGTYRSTFEEGAFNCYTADVSPTYAFVCQSLWAL